MRNPTLRARKGAQRGGGMPLGLSARKGATKNVAVTYPLGEHSEFKI